MALLPGHAAVVSDLVEMPLTLRAAMSVGRARQ